MQLFDRDIQKPTLLLDPTIAQRNIARMGSKAARQGVRLRPHFKTHQSAAVGEWFRAAGVDGITVSSVDMARYFAAAGWEDITIAFPVNPRQLVELAELAEAIRLNLLVEAPELVQLLSRRIQHPVNLWIKVDTGYGRTGIPWHEHTRLRALAEAIRAAPRHRFGGLLTHNGSTYHAGSAAEVRTLHDRSVARLNEARQVVGGETAVSIGDTPGCSLVDDWGAVHEARPGNYLFFDVMQQQLAACTAADIAVAVACPVVAKHEADRRIILYGGAVHLSKEQIEMAGRPCFGLVAPADSGGWSDPDPDSVLTGLSQEHGIVSAGRELFARVEVGDLLCVLPVHSCLTVDLYSHYLTIGGEILSKMVTNG